MSNPRVAPTRAFSLHGTSISPRHSHIQLSTVLNRRPELSRLPWLRESKACVPSTRRVCLDTTELNSLWPARIKRQLGVALEASATSNVLRRTRKPWSEWLPGRR
jgi:hypothetical protein